MYKRNHIYTSLVTSALLVGTFAANAQTPQEVESDVTVTVQNAFNLLEVAPLNFGSITVAQADGTSGDGSIDTPATIRILPTGAVSTVSTGTDATGTSVISIIAAGSFAEYTIDTAAPNTRMTLTVPAGAQPLSSPLTPATAVFNAAFVNADVLVVNSDGTEVAYNGINMRTDLAGAVGFKMGGTLTPVATDFDFDDGEYSGTYTVTVNY